MARTSATSVIGRTPLARREHVDGLHHSCLARLGLLVLAIHTTYSLRWLNGSASNADRAAAFRANRRCKSFSGVTTRFSRSTTTVPSVSTTLCDCRSRRRRSRPGAYLYRTADQVSSIAIIDTGFQSDLPAAARSCIPARSDSMPERTVRCNRIPELWCGGRWPGWCFSVPAPMASGTGLSNAAPRTGVVRPIRSRRFGRLGVRTPRRTSA